MEKTWDVVPAWVTVISIVFLFIIKNLPENALVGFCEKSKDFWGIHMKTNLTECNIFKVADLLHTCVRLLLNIGKQQVLDTPDLILPFFHFIREILQNSFIK